MSTSSDTGAALSALHAQLDDAARDAYWQSLARFLRFELSKSDFDRLALKALGASANNIALHNAVILALVRDAQRDAAPTHMSGLHAFGVPEVHGAANGAGGASSGAAGSSGAPGPGGVGGAAPAPQAGPKLMLKIRSDGRGGIDATSQRPVFQIDPLEEAQLNSLHERLLNLAKQHGLQVCTARRATARRPAHRPRHP